MVSVTKTFTPVVLLALGGFLAGGGCRVSNVKPITFPADYEPMQSGSEITVAPACAVFRELIVVDDRPDGTTDGVRTIQDRDGRSDIFMDGDVEAWLRAGVARGLVKSHFPQDSSAGLDLTMKLAAIRIEEVAYRNSTFEGRVIIDIELNRTGGGGSVWSHRTDGSAKNYGRPGKTENYQETVNHALDRAVTNAVNNEELRQKLCEVTTRAGVKPDSPSLDLVAVREPSQRLPSLRRAGSTEALSC
jgi:hypothetical protein